MLLPAFDWSEELVDGTEWLNYILEHQSQNGSVISYPAKYAALKFTKPLVRKGKVKLWHCSSDHWDALRLTDGEHPENGIIYLVEINGVWNAMV